MQLEEMFKLCEGKLVNARYLKRYFTFIEQRSKVKKNCYVEKHHILPRSLFQEYTKEPWNIVELTAREHYIAHYMLMKAFGGSMATAFTLMCNRFKELVNSKQYEEGRKFHSTFISKRLKEWHSKNPSTQELRDIRSKFNKGKITAFDVDSLTYVRVNVEELSNTIIPAGKVRSAKSRDKTSKALSKRIFWHNPITNQEIFIKVDALPPEGFVYGQHPKTIEKIAATMAKRYWWHDPSTGKQIRSEEIPEEGWVRGRINFGSNGIQKKKGA